MGRFKKINTAMALLVGLAIFFGLIGASVALLSSNRMLFPIINANVTKFLPIASQALSDQPAPKPGSIPTAKPTDLENLVAPIALYPDILLTQILPASTYPLEVAQAAHWLESRPDAEQPNHKDWAPSIILLLQFPQVLFFMNDRFDWMAELGDKFLTDPVAVLAAIQSTRAKALSVGLLIESPEQKITQTTITKVSTANQKNQGGWSVSSADSTNVQTRQRKVIRIEPVNPLDIHVPQYNPLFLTLKAPAVNDNSTQNETPVDPSNTTDSSSWITYSEGIRSDELLSWAISEWNDDIFDEAHQRYYQQPQISQYSGNLNGYDTEVDDISLYSDVTDSDLEENTKSILAQSIRSPWLHDPLHRRDYPYPPQAQLRSVSLKQQPALAGQRRSKAEIVNPDYAGYDSGKLKNLRLVHAKHSAAQETSNSLIVQADTQTPQTQNDLDPNLAANPENLNLTNESQTELTQANTPHSTDELSRQKLSNSRAIKAADVTDNDLDLNGSSSMQINIFSDGGNGNQVDMFSKRGKTSRAKQQLEDKSGSKKRK